MPFMKFLKTKMTAALALLLVSCLLLAGCDLAGNLSTDSFDPNGGNNTEAQTVADTGADTLSATDGEQTLAGSDSELEIPALSMPAFTPADAPAFAGEPFVAINGNVPFFTTNQITAESYEYYSPLDDLGRCGITVASVGQDMMPTEDRESISSVKPSGWQSVKYDASLVSGGYLYNRAHLIGFQLCGENANELNLITGTRYLNIDGMLPFENMVAAYVKEEVENHVLYRVTPIYYENDLVARGVLMEAYSVEDEGDGICFCVFVFNNQPGVTLDYATGANWLSGEPPVTTAPPATTSPSEAVYILNTKSKKFHDPDCSGAASISEANRQEYTGDRAYLIEAGYSPCGTCDP